jgi:hypothetical protein
VAGCAGVLFLAGCSADEPPAPDGPLPKVEHPKAPIPKDRDEQAVLSALRRVDPCALLDPSGGAVAGFPADLKPQASGPFTCSIDPSEGKYGGAVHVKFNRFTEDDRIKLPLLTLGGGKAYVKTHMTTCNVFLPVSFTMAIEFSTIVQEGADPCPAPKAFAQVAAPKLANPDAVQAPLSWDACGALRTAVGDGSLDYKPGIFGIEGCSTTSNGSLHFTHGWKSGSKATSETVGGKRVEVDATSNFGPGCSVGWRHGTARTQSARSNEFWVGVLLQDCAKAKALAERVMTVLASPPPEVAPQRPVLYGPDEADMAAPGACAHAGRPHDCQPYVEVPVPPGTKDKVRAAQADPNVECALAIEAVAKHFGPQWKPVIDSDLGCQFVEPARSGWISVNTNSARLSDTGRSDGESDATIAGHPGRVKADHVAVSLGKSADSDGQLFVTLWHLKDQSKAEAMVADILGRHFN